MNLRPVVSPEFDLRIFCNTVMDQDPGKVIEAISAEITYARHNHRATTKDRDFRKGSKGRKYCDDLMVLLRMFMGSGKPNPDTEFLSAISPLMCRLLTRWQIGELDIRLFQERL